MTIHCDWLVLCRRVIEDSQTRTLSLVDCLDRSDSVDGTYVDGTYQFRLVRIADGQDDLTVFEGDGDWLADVERMRVFVNFAVIKLTQAELSWSAERDGLRCGPAHCRPAPGRPRLRGAGPAWCAWWSWK
ncbi:MAG: hypothetical protein GXP62_09180 [Oligoflexia bacterium]|nr:hypothetical protein [Oligoflexia bacterium]